MKYRMWVKSPRDSDYQEGARTFDSRAEAMEALHFLRTMYRSWSFEIRIDSEAHE